MCLRQPAPLVESEKHREKPIACDGVIEASSVAAICWPWGEGEFEKSVREEEVETG